MIKQTPTITARAPGRINLIGEHTDYNEGFVMPAAVDRHMDMHLQRNGDARLCRLIAEDIEEVYEFDLDAIQPIEGGGWRNYLLGVIADLQKQGAQLTGFEGRFGGTVPIGSGMSSSAALECSLAVGLNHLFELGFDKPQLIQAAQMAEHHFVGIQVGIMDMFASVMGKKDRVILLDCRSLEFEYLPLELGAYELILLNSKVSHALADSAYNDRRAACEAGVELLRAKYPEIKSLRDVSFQQLEDAKSDLPAPIYGRCLHIVTENMRVQVVKKALEVSDLAQLGQQLYASHGSLQHLYEVSAPELDFLVDFSRDRPEVLGGRMMGGGFGGCTINLVRADQANAFIDATAAAYRTQFSIDLEPYRVAIEDGARVL